MSGNQGTSGATSQSLVQEYVVRVPKPDKKRYHVMRFNASLKVNVEGWNQVKIERENNLKDFKPEEEMPKFGAGSEFGRDLREEARKKKYGIISKKYNPDDQPWLLKVGGKSGKRYRGLREGGIAENASYYVFTQANDGAFEAYPISEWYQFTPIQTYKTLNAEEAEEEFGRRDKVFNYFTIMLKKRLKNDNDADGGGEDDEKNKKEKKKIKNSGEFKISEMDDWINSSEEDEDEDEGGSDKDDKQKAKGKLKQANKKKPKKKKKKKDESDEEAWEDSDDGDEEGREVDYITDGSSNNSDDEVDTKGKETSQEMQGVEDEEAIRQMEDSESEEENPEVKKENQEVKEETPAKEKVTKDKKEKKDGLSSESSSDTSDSDDFDNDTSFQSAMFMPDQIKSKKALRKIKKENAQGRSTSNSRSNTPTKPIENSLGKGGLKRSAPDGNDKEGIPNKKSKVNSGAGTSGSSSFHSMDGISEDSVRRYLMRKPMTTTELLQKFKSKKTGLGRDQMVNTITQILKRLNPEKQMIKQKMYLSIKQSH